MSVYKDVLIIDDDESIIEVLEMYCEDLNIFKSVIKANDGSEASRKLSNQKFDLILMDINMPKKSGVHLIKEFRRYTLNDISKVVVISGEIDKKVLHEATREGVKNFLVKPFDQETFKAKIIPVLKS